jgi:ABC-type thiamin/hydroxymethylpyrimidine transport system permease subunit
MKIVGLCAIYGMLLHLQTYNNIIYGMWSINAVVTILTIKQTQILKFG